MNDRQIRAWVWRGILLYVVAFFAGVAWLVKQALS